MRLGLIAYPNNSAEINILIAGSKKFKTLRFWVYKYFHNVNAKILMLFVQL